MNQPSFDLWREPWIHVQDETGRTALLSISDTLRQAHRWHTLADPSPLAVVGIHRLLVAILQDALKPERTADLAALWRLGRLPEEKLDTFEASYGDLFDLFSVDRPFLQSADLSLVPQKGDKVKSVLYLHHDWPAGSEATHYRHGHDRDAVLCPACGSAGLICQPAFATPGGSGIKPSINGVPPMYVLPQADDLWQSLLASLTTPTWQPNAADKDQDAVWWRHAPVIGFKDEQQRVGYLHALTFPARQVRLHPSKSTGARCSRCGKTASWTVSTMIFNMGESRPKEAVFWQDPFAAYKPRRNGKGDPLPVRPQSGRALWRDYAALFLSTDRDGSLGTLRPSVLDQIDVLAQRGAIPDADTLNVRCVGLRTDMKAKVFEWVDQGLELPLALLHSPEVAFEIDEGLDFTETAQSALRFVWKQSFGEGRSDRHTTLGSRMVDQYWAALSAPFARYVADCSHAVHSGRSEDLMVSAQQAWSQTVVDAAQHAFEQSAEQLGDDAVSLRQRVQGEAFCRALLQKRREEFASYD